MYTNCLNSYSHDTLVCITWRKKIHLSWILILLVILLTLNVCNILIQLAYSHVNSFICKKKQKKNKVSWFFYFKLTLCHWQIFSKFSTTNNLFLLILIPKYSLFFNKHQLQTYTMLRYFNVCMILLVCKLKPFFSCNNQSTLLRKLPSC